MDQDVYHSALDEDRLLTMKLERIFMPFATEQREKYASSGGRFVHYTSAANVINIIRHEQFWMRNTRCMNDYREVLHGQEQLQKFFQDEKRREMFFSALEPCGVGLGKEILDLFDNRWLSILHNTFITCISEHEDFEDTHGRLSMWRAYGEQRDRAALVLNIPLDPAATKGLDLLLSPVAYLQEEAVMNEIYGVIDNISRNIDFLLSLNDRERIRNVGLAMLIMASVCLKHEGFSEEREWRVICIPEIYDSPLEQSVEIIGGVPQVVCKIPLKDDAEKGITGVGIGSLIDKVIIGPSEYPTVIWEAVVMELTKREVKHASSRVSLSGIPLRV